ncbi:MAG: hypothetical protein ABIC68_02950 [Candidatus Omnitrophota bacterium]
MEAIETAYKNYKFRSRLEARWAVFFDSLGVKFEYEKEGFKLGKYYLPDFFLPEIRKGVWIEVKPDIISKKDIKANRLIYNLAQHTGCDSMLVKGEPILAIETGPSDAPGAWDGSAYWMCFGKDHPGGEDGPYVFCVCPWCGKVGIEFDGRGARVCGYKKHFKSEKKALNAIKDKGHWRADDKCYTWNDERIINACIAARQARFEFL